ncbi:MAG: hypothetical protein K6L73_06210 [Cellvibrionaceae bacterium]
MRITAEMSLYPLQSDYIPVIKGFIEKLKQRDDIKIFTSTTSTQINGEFDAVNCAITEAMEMSFKAFKQQILVVKYLNGDIPVGQHNE